MQQSAVRPALVVVPTYMSAPADLGLVLETLESVRATEPDCELLVVDDCSPVQGLVDEIDAASTRLQFDLVRQPTNEGFSRTVNVGLQRALDTERDAVLLNADVELIDAGWLEVCHNQRSQSDDKEAGIVGALLLYPNGLIQHGGIFFSLLARCFEHRFRYGPGDLAEAHLAARCPVTGALQYIRWEVLNEVGIYDPEFRMGWEDVDFCLRAFQAGWDCVYQPKVRAFHHESVFRGRPSPKVEDWQARSWLLFNRKWARTSFTDYVPSII